MKRSVALPLSVCFLFLAGAGAVSQISQIGGSSEARLSGQCQSVNDKEVMTLNMGDIRVRRGGQVRAGGVRQAIYIEAGGMAEVTSTGSFIYVAKGAKVTVGGERNQIITEPGGNVILVGKAIMTVVGNIDLMVHKNSAACQ
jgi:hypothetical protein